MDLLHKLRAIESRLAMFEDAAATSGLAGTDPAIRQKIVDFMCGVNFAQEGTWEELGENIYMVVPASAYVEVAPATPRMAAIKN